MLAPPKNLFCLALSAMALAHPGGAETRRALLVGVSRYPEQCPWPSLPGVANDVALVRTTLLARGFESKDVVVLRDQEATRKAILEELDKLAAKSHRGDVALFYFAGHGSRLPDTGKDELDAFDETIVPFDAGAGPDKANDLRDDALAAWIARANQRTDQVVLVFDCCSSGTVTRGGGDAGRFLDPSIRGFDVPRRSLAAEDPAAGRSGWTPAGSRYVALSACRADQSAHEIVVPPAKEGEQPRLHGAFTWQFAKALSELGPEATYGDVLAHVSARLRVDGGAQTPVIEGALAHYRLFANEAAPDARRYALERAEDGAWLLRGGRMDALTEGALLAVGPDGARHDARAARVGRVRLERADRETSLVRWIEGEPDGSGPRAFAAFLLEHGTGGVRLGIEVQGGDAAAQELERRLEATNLLVASAPHDADYVLAREVGPTRERWVLKSRRGRALPIAAALASQEELGKLVEGLARLALARRTRALLENGATNALAVEFGARAGDDPGSAHALEQNAAGEWLAPADFPVRLEFTNAAPIALFVAVLWIGPDGEVSWVGGSSTEDAVEPGKSFVLTARFEVPPGGEAFHADGPVEIVCVASPRLHDFGPLFQEGAPVATTRGGGTTGAQVDPLACEGWTSRTLRFALSPSAR